MSKPTMSCMAATYSVADKSAPSLSEFALEQTDELHTLRVPLGSMAERLRAELRGGRPVALRFGKSGPGGKEGCRIIKGGGGNQIESRGGGVELGSSLKGGLSQIVSREI